MIELNRAVAIAMRDGPQAGLDLIEAILARGDLHDYYLAHSARAEPVPSAWKNDRCARGLPTSPLELAKVTPEREFLAERINSL